MTKPKRIGLSLFELFEKFPDDATAEAWFESWIWPEGPVCPDCGNMDVAEAKHPTMPYRCPECRKYFSVKKGSVMHSSNLGYRKWAIAIYQMATNLKGVSARKLGRDLDIRTASAWHMMHRIREAMDNGGIHPMLGDVEVDETYIGGKEKNRHRSKRAKNRIEAMAKKTIVIGAKARGSKRVQAAVIPAATAYQLRGFVYELMLTGKLYTDDHRGYQKLPNRVVVNHSKGQYVHGEAHTQGIESFWSMLKRGIYGIYHQVSVKHLHRYLAEFAGRTICAATARQNRWAYWLGA